MAVTQLAQGNPIFATALDAVIGRKRVSHFKWTGAASAGDALSVTDTAGNVIVSGVAPVASYEAIYPLEGSKQWCEGIIAAVMGSGTLQAFFL